MGGKGSAWREGNTEVETVGKMKQLKQLKRKGAQIGKRGKWRGGGDRREVRDGRQRQESRRRK